MAGRTWGLVVAVVIVVIVVVVVVVVMVVVVVVQESERRRVSTLWAESMLPAVEAGLSVSVVQTAIFRVARSSGRKMPASPSNLISQSRPLMLESVTVRVLAVFLSKCLVTGCGRIKLPKYTTKEFRGERAVGTKGLIVCSLMCNGAGSRAFTTRTLY